MCCWDAEDLGLGCDGDCGAAMGTWSVSGKQCFRGKQP